MPQLRRNRWMMLGLLLLVVALGLGSRSRGMPEAIVLYAGDVLWGSMFFVLFGLLLPAGSTLRVWLEATALAELIELSQIYQADWANAVRATRVGGLLLGHAFLWSDVLGIIVGTTFAALLDACARHGVSTRDHAERR